MHKITLFFTWDVSLALWAEKGLLQREIRIYESLAKKGVDVTFLSWGGEEDEAIAKTLPAGIKTISLYNHIPRPKNKALRALCSLLVPWKIREHLKQTDIIKTNQMWGAWVAALAKIMVGKPMILRCGFELYDFTVRQNHGRLRRAFTWLISRLSYGIADRINVATIEDRQVVTNVFGQAPDKTHLHPNWIDTKFFAPRDVEEKQDHILFVGRMSEQKNIPALITAMAQTDYILDMIGAGEMKDELEAQAKTQGAKVNFLGPRPNDQLPEIYSQYPVYILPSFYEGNPKTLLEAMSCASAVIGTDVSGIASLLRDGENGLVAQIDSKSLTETIKKLMADKALRKRLGTAARAQIEADQTLDKLIDKELACYDLLKEKT